MVKVKNNAINLEVSNNADGFEVGGGSIKRVLGVTGGNVTITGGGAYTYTFPSASGTLALTTDIPTLTSKFIVQGTSDAKLSAAQFLGALATGLVKNTTTTGVLSIATAGTDYVAPNAAITGATKTKITYDAKGLVTSGADATTADIADSADKRYCTDAQKTVIGNTSGTNTGDETTLTIKTKLGAASGSADGYLTSTDWSTFNGKQAALGFTPENAANKNQASGYVGLEADGKISSSYLPSIAITDVFVVASQAAMLALSTADKGDVAVRTDENKTYILTALPYSTLSNWQLLLSPTDTVTSVFGRTGAVTATSGDYTADQITETASRVFLSPAQKTVATQAATASLNGYLSSTDWTTFNNKQAALSIASAADLRTGTDNAKLVTCKTIKDSLNVPDVAPGTAGNVMTSDGTKWTSSAPSNSTDDVTVNGTLTARNSVTLVRANKASTLLTITLPSASGLTVGKSIYKIVGVGTGGWKIAQNAADTIIFGDTTTTKGTAGYISSTDARDCVELALVYKNGTSDYHWQVISSIGNITMA